MGRGSFTGAPGSLVVSRVSCSAATYDGSGPGAGWLRALQPRCEGRLVSSCDGRSCGRSGFGAGDIAGRRVRTAVDQEAEGGRGVRAEGTVVRGVPDADRAAGAGVDAVPDVDDGLSARQRQ